MNNNLFNVLTLLLCLGLSTGLYSSDEPSVAREIAQKPSTISEIIDTAICCAHWIACPYCLKDPTRQTTKLRKAIDDNDTKEINHIICRRGLSPNQPILEEQLAIIYAAKKAQADSVEELLRLGADVNSQLKDAAHRFPSTLIAVCSTENLPPERVTQTVKVLLEHGANSHRSCCMLTEQEINRLSELREELAKDPTPANERRLGAQIPSAWFRPRTALDFAIKNKYTAAGQILRQAMASQQKEGITEEQDE